MKKTPLKRIIDSNRVGLGTVEGNLLSAAKERRIRTIYVTSARPQEGKTVTAASLAYGLSITVSDPVLLVEGSTTNPCFSDFFAFDDSRGGLADYLWSRVSLDDAAQATEYPNFMLIPGTGEGLENGSREQRGSLNGTTFRDKLKELQERFSYVIFDGDAVFASSLPSVQARYFDGVIITVECGRTKWEVVNLARNKLTDAGAKVLGVVLNKREYAIPSSLYTKV